MPSPDKKTTLAAEQLTAALRKTPGAFLSAYAVLGVRVDDPNARVVLFSGANQRDRESVQDIILELADEIRAHRKHKG